MPKRMFKGYGYPRGFWYPVNEAVNYEEVKKRAKEILANAQKGAVWTNPWGYTRIPVIHNNQVIGWLAEDVDLNDLEIGAYRFAKFGIKVQLVKEGRVVGEVGLPY